MSKAIIITAPSGAGKSTIVKAVMQQLPQLAFSVSATTRPARVGEVNGKDYHFITVEDFETKIKSYAFLEWEKVYEGKYYGTLKSEIERIHIGGQFPVLDIDVFGALNIQALLKENCCSIFIEPPSIDVLKQRLLARGTETEATLNERITKAEIEIEQANKFNYVVVNDELANATAEVYTIIKRFIGA
jgi:guanylate kinase